MSEGSRKGEKWRLGVKAKDGDGVAGHLVQIARFRVEADDVALVQETGRACGERLPASNRAVH